MTHSPGPHASKPPVDRRPNASRDVSQCDMSGSAVDIETRIRKSAANQLVKDAGCHLIERSILRPDAKYEAGGKQTDVGPRRGSP